MAIECCDGVGFSTHYKLQKQDAHLMSTAFVYQFPGDSRFGVSDITICVYLQFLGGNQLTGQSYTRTEYKKFTLAHAFTRRCILNNLSK